MDHLQKDGLDIVAFPVKQDFYDWLNEYHNTSPGIWLRFYKKHTGIATIVWEEAVEVALCYGWIDSVINKYDESSYIHRFTPRRPRSIWSKKNCQTAERLIEHNLMHKSGLLQVAQAKADGRWVAAYDSPKDMKVPLDFVESLNDYPEAKALYKTLNKANLYSIAFRLNTAKKSETREKRKQQIIEMLTAGKKFH